MTAVGIPGNLVYRGGMTGVIAPTGDQDSFVLRLDAHQTLTVDVRSDANLRAAVRLIDQNGNVLADGTAATAGQEVLLNTVTLTGEGFYGVDIK